MESLRICYVCKQSKPIDQICPNRKCRDCMAKYKKTWYEANKAQISARQEQYRSSNHSYLRQKDKEWRQNNKEKDRIRVSKWARDNPDKRAESEQRRRAKKNHGQVVRITTSMLKDRLAVFDGLCAYCGGPFEHWDHVKAINLGGPHILANLRPSCARCNLSKGDSPFVEWFAKVRVART